MNTDSLDQVGALAAGTQHKRALHPAPLVQFEDISKRFSTGVAVDKVSLDVSEGEFFALLGPSGCGKTTLLRMLAGLEMPDSGRILLDGKDLATVPPHRRPINMMFQSYALFPHLNVEDNIAFGLKQDRFSRKEIASRVAQMLSLVRLEGYEKRKPNQLSGGERQRVALARSLAKRPRVLLLDEPLAALDKKLRNQTQLELVSLQEQLGLTFIIVTHDQQEAMTMAGRIGVMRQGQLMQVGPPAQVYEYPSSRWVADFVGDVNLIEGHVVAAGPDELLIGTQLAGELRAASHRDCKSGDTVWIALRPEKVHLSWDRAGAGEANCMSGKVCTVAYLGEHSTYHVKLDGGFVMQAKLPNVRRAVEQTIRSADRIWLSWAVDAAVVLTQ